MSKTRKSYDPELKMQLVLEVLQGRRIVDVSKEHGIHHATISRWKKEFLDGGHNALNHKFKVESKKDSELLKLKKENDQMKRIIGDQKVQLEILKKKPWLD